MTLSAVDTIGDFMDYCENYERSVDYYQLMREEYQLDLIRAALQVTDGDFTESAEDRLLLEAMVADRTREAVAKRGEAVKLFLRRFESFFGKMFTGGRFRDWRQALVAKMEKLIDMLDGEADREGTAQNIGKLKSQMDAEAGSVRQGPGKVRGSGDGSQGLPDGILTFSDKINRLNRATGAIKFDSSAYVDLGRLPVPEIDGGGCKELGAIAGLLEDSKDKSANRYGRAYHAKPSGANMDPIVFLDKLVGNIPGVMDYAGAVVKEVEGRVDKCNSSGYGDIKRLKDLQQLMLFLNKMLVVLRSDGDKIKAFKV